MLLSAACYRTVEHERPLTAADCGPPQHLQAFGRHSADANMPGIIHGSVSYGLAADGVPLPLEGAVVLVPQLGRAARSDSAGRFRIDSVPSGRYAVETRRIGFRMRRDTAVVSGTAGSRLDIGLQPEPLDGCPGYMVGVERKRVWRWPWQ